MITGILLVSAALIAQTGPALYGDIPEGVPTFQLNVNGQELGAVALVNGRDWWDKPETDSLPAGGVGVRYMPDTPWIKFDIESLQRLPRGATLVPEVARMRLERLRTQWVEQGYTFVTTPGGDTPVRRADIELAKQSAAESARVAKLSAPENTWIGTTEAAAAEPEAQPAAPAWRGYIGHAVLIVVALIAGAVIVKVLIIGEDDGWERVG